jgi:PAS domain S-box-containing protein
MKIWNRCPSAVLKIAWLVSRDRRLPFAWMLLALGVFLVTRLLSHAGNAAVLGVPFYWLASHVEMVTAVTSIASASALPFFFPKLSRLLDAAFSTRLNERRFLAASEGNNHSFAILESVRDASGEVVDFRFAYINAVGAKLMFDTPEKIVGTLYTQRMPLQSARGTFALYKQVIETGVAQQADLHVPAGDLDATWLHIHVGKLDDAVAVTATDISKLKQAAEDLAAKNLLIQENERRLAEIQKLARLGDWEYTFSTDTFRWSAEVYEMFEVAPENPPLSTTEIARRIHPDDRERLLAVTLQVMDGEAPENLYARIHRASGGVRYLQGRAQRHLDASGKVERLTGTIIDVTEKIELHDAVRASDARFEVFMENSPALTFIKDREGRMLYMNRVCMDTWNFDHATAQGKFDTELWSPEIGAELRILDLMVLNTDTPDSLIEVMPIPGGKTISLLTHKFPLRIPGKETLIGGVSIDITEQKEAEALTLQALAERDILLKEVHHRVKNNLQVICSLLGMQAAVSSDPRTVAALRVSQDRVQSMAMIHELLYGAKSAGDIDFSEYAARLTSELFASYGMTSPRVRPRFNVVPMQLGADRAILCGLIMNELISNSLKYAFPFLEQGEIVISLAPDGMDFMRMAISDNGIGMPEGFVIESAHSLGLRVVQILVKQLDGTMTFTSHNGTQFEMTFPIGELHPHGPPLRP